MSASRHFDAAKQESKLKLEKTREKLGDVDDELQQTFRVLEAEVSLCVVLSLALYLHVFTIGPTKR